MRSSISRAGLFASLFGLLLGGSFAGLAAPVEVDAGDAEGDVDMSVLSAVMDVVALRSHVQTLENSVEIRLYLDYSLDTSRNVLCTYDCWGIAHAEVLAFSTQDATPAAQCGSGPGDCLTGMTYSCTDNLCAFPTFIDGVIQIPAGSNGEEEFTIQGPARGVADTDGDGVIDEQPISQPSASNIVSAGAITPSGPVQIYPDV